jgi:tripartite-type tricarboxylate transporter receptor subunit TctC
MRAPRRKFLQAAAGAAVAQFAAGVASALDYPTRPVRVIEGFGGGGSPDIHARLISQWLSERLGQPFIVENRIGAASTIATETVVRAPPDGYTLLICLSANVINATLYNNLNYIFIRDIAPVAELVRVPMVMVVTPTLPAATVPEFLAYARANPGKINMASSGNGTPLHVAGELFKMMTKIDIIHVPYRGIAPAMSDLLGGRMQVMFATIPSCIGYIRGGQLRALAVTTPARLPALPEIPAVADFVPGFEAIAWVGIGAPAHTPADIIGRLNTEINAALVDHRIAARLAALGGIPTPATPAEFGKLIVDETEKWGRVIRAANIKLD